MEQVGGVCPGDWKCAISTVSSSQRMICWRLTVLLNEPVNLANKRLLPCPSCCTCVIMRALPA